jgi:hypothetical protein
VNSSDDRDQSIERLLRQSLRTPQQDVTDSCLDAETLAAWMDGSLFGPALEVAQSHVADCSRCRAVVGAVARAEAAVPAMAPVSRRWSAWFVPMAASGLAAAVAVTLWVVVPRNTDLAPTTTQPTEQGTQTRVEERASAPATVQAPSAAQEKRDEAPKDSERQFEADSLRKQPADIGAASTPSRTDERTRAAAPPAPAAEREAFRAGSANTLAASSAIGIEIPSPDAAVRWRIVGSAVQRSTNGGARWEPVPTGTSGDLLAGAAASATVCWLVGRAGVVLVSMDGLQFRRVTFPEMTDLSAVSATDARSASVSTIDGRIFATTDAGQTWERR